jgi:hypothetical protein
MNAINTTPIPVSSAGSVVSGTVDNGIMARCSVAERALAANP